MAWLALLADGIAMILVRVVMECATEFVDGCAAVSRSRSFERMICLAAGSRTVELYMYDILKARCLISRQTRAHT